LLSRNNRVRNIGISVNIDINISNVFPLHDELIESQLAELDNSKPIIHIESDSDSELGSVIEEDYIR